MPDQGDISSTAGNAPDYVKQLNYNTFFSYGVGDAECFGYKAGKDVKFVDVTVDRSLEHHGRMEATTIAEVVVNRGQSSWLLWIDLAAILTRFDWTGMLNGAGMLHGGCIAYLIDK